MLRKLLQVLLTNEQVIQRLADSYPIRRSAQLTAYLFHRGKEVGEQSLEKMQESDVYQRLQQEAQQSGKKFDNFKDTFSKEVEEGFREIREDLKKKK